MLYDINCQMWEWDRCLRCRAPTHSFLVNFTAQNGAHNHKLRSRKEEKGKQIVFHASTKMSSRIAFFVRIVRAYRFTVCYVEQKEIQCISFASIYCFCVFLCFVEVELVFIFLIIFIQSLKTRIKPFYLFTDYDADIQSNANESALRSAFCHHQCRYMQWLLVIRYLHSIFICRFKISHCASLKTDLIPSELYGRT